MHHHRQLSQLAAAWILLEDIQADAGPLVYYKGSHRPDQLGFFDWGEGAILASRDALDDLFSAYSRHLDAVITASSLQPSIFLPKRGDLLIWHGALIHGGTRMTNPLLTRRSFICHYTSMASHKHAQRFRISNGYSFDQPPQLPYQPSLPRRLMQGFNQRIGAMIRG